MSSRGVLPVRRVCLLKCRHLLSPPPLRGRDREGGSRVRQTHPLRLRCDPPPFAAKRGRAPPQGGSGEHVATLQKHPPRERASPQGEVWTGVQRLYDPVEPKPPCPRSVSPSAATETTSTWATGATTSWAMRSPRRTVKASAPKLARSPMTSPR